MTTGSNNSLDAEERIAFATITREGKIVEKSYEIDEKSIDKVSELLKVVLKISDKTEYPCGRLRFIKLDGYKKGFTYRLLVYSISESLYSIIFTRASFKEVFIPEIDELNTIGKVIYETMGDAAENILFKLGEKLGSACTQRFNEMGMRPEEAIKGAATTLNAINIMDSEWEIEKEKAAVTVYMPREESADTWNYSKYYARGVITGMLKTAFKSAINVKFINAEQIADDKYKFIFEIINLYIN